MPGLKVRVGLLRAFIAVLWAALLVVPVGVHGSGGPVVASVGDALAEISRGNLDISILGALATGDDLARAALIRIFLVVLAALAFYLAGLLHSVPESVPRPSGRRRCPHCEAWISKDMADCPKCGRTVQGDH